MAADQSCTIAAGLEKVPGVCCARAHQVSYTVMLNTVLLFAIALLLFAVRFSLVDATVRDSDVFGSPISSRARSQRPTLLNGLPGDTDVAAAAQFPAHMHTVSKVSTAFRPGPAGSLPAIGNVTSENRSLLPHPPRVGSGGGRTRRRPFARPGRATALPRCIIRRRHPRAHPVPRNSNWEPWMGRLRRRRRCQLHPTALACRTVLCNRRRVLGRDVNKSGRRRRRGFWGSGGPRNTSYRRRRFPAVRAHRRGRRGAGGTAPAADRAAASSPSAAGFRDVRLDGPVLVVDQAAGNAGAFTTVQAAVDAVEQGSTKRVVIQINPGTYREKVTVPAGKPFVTFQGAGLWNTEIVWHNTASDVDDFGRPLSAYNSATVSVFASNFVARNISFKNTAPAPAPGEVGKQAAAFRISGDQAAFYGCGFFGAQDTLCDDEGRHYFKECYIQGSIDYIFGNGQSLYQNCELNTIAQTFGSIAAQNRKDPSSRTGFAFVNCVVSGTGRVVYLGRAMGEYSRVVFAYTYLNEIIAPQGWDDWGHQDYKHDTVYFGQHQCSGPGADQSRRVPWSHELSPDEAQQFLHLSFIDGDQWL